MANETVYTASGSTNFAYQYEGGNGNGSFWCGHDPSLGNEDGALRFTSVALNQNATVSLATLRVYIESRDGSSQVNAKIYGIKEGNTSDFSSSPFGRTRTSAYVTSGNSEGAGNYWTINVASVVNEILGQGGWSSGNAMGFVLINDGTTGDNAIFDYSSGTNSQFVARENPEPDFTPTPGSIAAPTFPAASHFGMKFAKPGVNVLTATESELYFTTRKKPFKVFMFGSQTMSTPYVEITHNLGYAPAVLLYGGADDKVWTNMIKMPRLFRPATDPLGFNAEWWVYADNTVVRVYGSPETDGLVFYYYIFIDPLT